MSCRHEINAQIKGIQARLSQAENNITSHYVGISTLVKALATTPAAAAAAAVDSFYNLVPSGFDALQKLVDQLGPLDTKALMMKAAAMLEDAMAAELEALAGMVESAIQGAIDAAMGAVEAAIASVEAAVIALEDAVASGVQEAIDLATDALNSAKAVADAAQSALDALGNLKLSAKSLLETQADAAKCKSISFHITT